ncbi:MAG: hypothetical protein ABIS68_09690 [Casimicrobiaceae bacterium]
MQKKSMLIAAMLAGAMLVGGSVQAAKHVAPGGMSMGQMMTKDMDADKDGMITKDEYMKKMGTMWDKADKDKKGKVPMADLEKVFNTMGGG